MIQNNFIDTSPRESKKDYSNISQQDYESVAGNSWPTFNEFITQKNIPDFVYSELSELLVESENSAPANFCVLPFYGYEFPLNTPCCLMTNNEPIEEVQRLMLQGERPSSCEKCWKLEDAGLESDRLLKNGMLDSWTDTSIDSLFNDCVEGNNKILSYKIDTSNTCNAACVTCGPGSSSTWAKLFAKNKTSTKYKSWQITPEQTRDFVNYSSAKTISFRGGEPFLSKTNFYILEQLIKNNNTDCFISFVTNGGSQLNDRQKEILKNFKNLNFCFSIDGVGGVFEYLRWPLSWDILLGNIAWAKENNIDVSVSYTISNINLIYLKDTIKWFNENNIKYILNPVESPAVFTPSTLPLKMKSQLKDLLGDTVPSEWFDHTEEDDKNFELFKLEIKKQDLWKNITINDMLPEFAHLAEI